MGSLIVAEGRRIDLWSVVLVGKSDVLIQCFMLMC